MCVYMSMIVNDCICVLLYIHTRSYSDMRTSSVPQPLKLPRLPVIGSQGLACACSPACCRACLGTATQIWGAKQDALLGSGLVAPWKNPSWGESSQNEQKMVDSNHQQPVDDIWMCTSTLVKYGKSRDLTSHTPKSWDFHLAFPLRNHQKKSGPLIMLIRSHRSQSSTRRPSSPTGSGAAHILKLFSVWRYRFQAHWNLVGGWATPLKNMKVNWDD